MCVCVCVCVSAAHNHSDKHVFTYCILDIVEARKRVVQAEKPVA